MKKLLLFPFLILLISCNSQSKNKKLVDALSNNELKLRGSIHKIDTEYRLDYYDVYEKDTHMNYLQEKGFQGGGPSWKGIIYGGLKLSDQTILTQIRFDDEAEGIAIWSREKNSLEKISRLISKLKSDNKLLDEAIKVASLDWKME